MRSQATLQRPQIIEKYDRKANLMKWKKQLSGDCPSRRRRKGEILCHNHVIHTAATANGVHGFHWFTVCAPAGWDPASDEWEVCPCGWRHELGKHYAKADHVQWWREQIKERGSFEAVYREVRKRQREYRDRDMG
ncbi:MAG TPA: hypothetical protein VK657_06080 [Terriglobales bacterium]|nr:hypothetical protein [Terriglobales bacterium]